MKVEIKVDPLLEKEYICLYVTKKTEKVDKLSKIIEGIDNTLTVTDNDGEKIVLAVSDIVSVHAVIWTGR